MRLSQKAQNDFMDEMKANLVALVEADADNARTRAQRLRILAKFIVGDEQQILMQANLEEVLLRRMRRLPSVCERNGGFEIELFGRAVD
jgi:hypothetical protein